MLVYDTRINNYFSGTIAGIEINDSGTFFTVDWFLDNMLELIEFEESLAIEFKDLIRELIIATERFESRVDYFSRAELENDLYNRLNGNTDYVYCFDKVFDIIDTHRKGD